MVFDKSDLPTTDIHESAIRMFEFPAQTNIPLSKTENNCFQSHLFFITLYQNNARKIQNKAVAACCSSSVKNFTYYLAFGIFPFRKFP